MLSVPSVTIKGGSSSRVTSSPLTSPKRVVAAIPMKIASTGFTPLETANLVIKTEPSAIMSPLDRSMPRVKIINVCPMASVPTTITCCTTKDRLRPVKKRSLCDAKKAPATSSAKSGPTAGARSTRKIGLFLKRFN